MAGRSLCLEFLFKRTKPIKRTKPTAQSRLSTRIFFIITKTRKYVGSDTNQVLSYYVDGLNYDPNINL
jgi:hypothetical protein